MLTRTLGVAWALGVVHLEVGKNVVCMWANEHRCDNWSSCCKMWLYVLLYVLLPLSVKRTALVLLPLFGITFRNQWWVVCICMLWHALLHAG
jgi:uncharacterized membrane protein HdeD (DUF308 family)